MEGTLTLRGTRLVGTAQQPVWRFPNGIERTWIRVVPLTKEHIVWRELFHEYKGSLMQLRRQIWASLATEDPHAADLQLSWEAGGSIPKVSLEQQARLAAGRQLVPGVCFTHLLYGYRGVILACEPWCNATEAWKSQMGISKLPRKGTQPFYHCIVDERDRPGAQTTFVAEENVQPTEEVFPVQARLSDLLFLRCDELRGYLPTPRLESALQRQRAGESFEIR